MITEWIRPALRSAFATLCMFAAVLLIGGVVPMASATAQTPFQKVVGDVLDEGVVIVISTGSQNMHVFQNGELWRSSPVSTGKKGKETPPGVFAILQKKKFHRSNLYDNAPMPYMQRLTWDGIAIHAGALPGYPASHGCIRLPKAFARELFALTEFASTAVIVVDEPVENDTDALTLARARDEVIPISKAHLKREQRVKAPVRTIAKRTIPARGPEVSGGQTIQLAAALSPREASERWQTLSAQRPELQSMQMAVIPAMVKGTQYYRLRASSPDAHATCRSLKRAGIDCFPVS